MSRFKKTLCSRPYNSRNGIILGVCKGISEHFGFSVFWTRVITLIFLAISNCWVILGLYFAAGLLIKKKVLFPIHADEEQVPYKSHIYCRNASVYRIKRKCANLEQRLLQLENRAIEPEFDWRHRPND